MSTRLLGLLEAQEVDPITEVYILVAINDSSANKVHRIYHVALFFQVKKSLIEIDKLQRDLLDAKYRALSSSSQLTEKSRESNVLELLQSNKDSLLQIATQPPFIINVPEK